MNAPLRIGGATVAEHLKWCRMTLADDENLGRELRYVIECFRDALELLQT